MISVQSLRVEFGARVLFNDLAFSVQPRERIAFAGHNGAGKSTLMKCIAGLLPPSAGAIHAPKGTRIGYLPQEGIHVTGRSLWVETEAAFGEAVALRGKIDRLSRELTKLDPRSSPYAEMLEDIGELELQLDATNPERMKPRIESVLQGLGFQKSDFTRDCSEFSGGWQMRIAMARLFLQEPEVMLLDEPTNHLDIDSLRWLENYLVNYEHSYIIVSHDRFFLDKLTTKTLEIAFSRIHEYKGNYSYYEKEKAERYELLMGKYANDLKKMEELKAFVDRFRYKATKARQAQSRLKQMEKLESQLESPEEDLSRISFRFPKAMPSGREVMRLDGVKKAYDLPDGTKKQVLNGINLEVMRGDRIAIVGSNGAGKSTFCKIIAGQLDFDGKLTMGHNVSLNYFSQHQTESLSPEKSMYNEMLDAAPNSEAQKKVRDILGCFLFSGDAVNKKIKVLSGGEKSRVALAKILLQASNLLIMDEPTNHLDMRSKEMLIDSLENYDGTLLLVSHDRYFLDSLVNKVIEIKNGSMQLYLDTYAEYLEKAEKALEAEKLQEAAARQKPQAAAPKSSTKSEESKKSTPAKKDRRKIEEIEQKINRLEQQKEKLEAIMANEDFYKKSQEETTKTLDSYHALSSELNQLFAEWEKASS